jgi:hypothetical protein
MPRVSYIEISLQVIYCGSPHPQIKKERGGDAIKIQRGPRKDTI